MGFVSHHIMPLLINSLRGGHIYKHADLLDKSNFKKSGAWFKIFYYSYNVFGYGMIFCIK